MKRPEASPFGTPAAVQDQLIILLTPHMTNQFRWCGVCKHHVLDPAGHLITVALREGWKITPPNISAD